jgi:triphosphoribosyl-dephospho-CoA synthetase
MVYKKTRTTRLYQVVKTTCSTGTNKHIIVIVDRSTLQHLAQHQETTQATSTARARAMTMAVVTTMSLCHSFKRVKQTSHKERQQLLTKILQWTRLIMRVRPKTMSPVTRAL